MTPIGIPLQRVRVCVPRWSGLSRGQGGDVLLGDDVLVHAVQKPLDDAKLDQAPHVDEPQHVEPRVQVHLEPLHHGPPRAEARHQLDEQEVAHPWGCARVRRAVVMVMRGWRRLGRRAAAKVVVVDRRARGGIPSTVSATAAAAGGTRRHDADVGGALIDDAVEVRDELVDGGAGRVARAKEEHVEEENGVVVEQVAEGQLGQVDGDVG